MKPTLKIVTAAAMSLAVCLSVCLPMSLLSLACIKNPVEEEGGGNNNNNNNNNNNGRPVRGENGYILIRDFAELCRIGNDTAFKLNDRYELAADIDASASKNMNGGNGFYGIGRNSSNRFTGTFDGKGHTISNLYVFTPQSSAGLFINNSGNITGVNVVDPDMVGNDYVGALVASNSGNISECSSTGGTLTGTSRVGGLIGYCSGGQITKCNSSNNVSGTSDVGGLVGGIVDCSIAQCYATGRVKGTSYVGGFVGKMDCIGTCYASSLSVMLCYSSGAVDGTGGSYIGGFSGQTLTATRCYSFGNVNGNDYVGGFAGELSFGTLLQCYSVGGVSAVFDHYGGLVGTSFVGSTTDSYFDSTTVGFTSTSNMARSTAEMKRKATFAGWDFDVFWQIDEGVSYPYLKILGPTVAAR